MSPFSAASLFAFFIEGEMRRGGEGWKEVMIVLLFSNFLLLLKVRRIYGGPRFAFEREREMEEGGTPKRNWMRWFFYVCKETSSEKCTHNLQINKIICPSFLSLWFRFKICSIQISGTRNWTFSASYLFSIVQFFNGFKGSSKLHESKHHTAQVDNSSPVTRGKSKMMTQLVSNKSLREGSSSKLVEMSSTHHLSICMAYLNPASHLVLHLIQVQVADLILDDLLDLQNFVDGRNLRLPFTPQ